MMIAGEEEEEVLISITDHFPPLIVLPFLQMHFKHISNTVQIHCKYGANGVQQQQLNSNSAKHRVQSKMPLTD